MVELIIFEKLVLEELYDEEIFEEYLERNIVTIDENLKYSCIKDEVKTEFLEMSTLEYLEEVSKIEFLSDEELVALQKIDSIETRDELVTKGLRIPVISGMYIFKDGVDYLDLIQEGSIGLIESIKKFSGSGYKSFEDYARIYIIRRMVMYVDEKLKESKAQFISYFEKLKGEYNENDEILEELDKKIQKVTSITYFDLENILNQLEIDVLDEYYGFKSGKKSSMYEIEKKYNLEKEKGEKLFQESINKLSKFGGEFFKI